jgi:hypothetical protein
MCENIRPRKLLGLILIIFILLARSVEIIKINAVQVHMLCDY